MHIYIFSLMYFINHLLHCYYHHPEVVAALLDPQALQTLQTKSSLEMSLTSTTITLPDLMISVTMKSSHYFVVHSIILYRDHSP